MKKSILILIVVSFVLANINFTSVYADKSIYVDARAAIAIDSSTKRVLFDKNAQTILPMASTTKIITTLVALKYGDLDKKIEISKKAANIHGSQVGYKAGEKVTLKELLYGLMLRSGNDAAIAIAEGIGGTVEGFVKLMNEYALEIGLVNSHFESPHGLDSAYHYSTAYDLAIASAKAKEYKLFNDIVSAKDVEASDYNFTRSYHNINKILWRIEGANGIKTGYTGDAGRCLVTSVNYEGKDIIIVVLNCYKRWNETTKIFNYVKKNYEYKEIAHKGDTIADIRLEDSNQELYLILDKDITLPVKKDGELAMECDIKKNIDNSKYPIVKGTKLGKLMIYENEELIYQEALLVKETIQKQNLMNKIFKILKFRKIPST